MPHVQISISMIMGFGFCPQSGPEVEGDGARTFTYRYLPPGLWSNDLQIVRALLNSTAKFFPTFQELPDDLLPSMPEAAAESLSEAGRAFLDTCPVYAKLSAKEPWLTWEQHHPEGGVAWSARTNDLKIFESEILCQWPINLWAQKFLGPWKDWLEPHPKHGSIALYMQPPLPELEAPKVDEEGWNEGLDNLRADVHERIEAPWGPFKVLLVSCAEDRVSGCKKMQFSDAFRLLPSALAVRNTKSDPFRWREHHVFRFETPMQLLPRQIKWCLDEEVAHPGAWSARLIVPCYAWDRPEVRYQLRPEEAGWETTCIVFKPLEELDELALARYEHDLATMPRPPKP